MRTGQADAKTFSDLGALLLRAGQTQQAAGVLEQCAAAAPFDPECYRMLLDAYTALRQKPQFESTARKYSELFPEDADTQKRIDLDRQKLGR